MMKIQKVCPVIIRQNGSRKEILVFRHPAGDIQIVKGTVEANEDLQIATLRELKEESGIEKVSNIEPKGIWVTGYDNQIWHFYLCSVEEKLPKTWTYFANDDGGLDFSFFWFDLSENPSDEWHLIFQAALVFIKTHSF